MSVNFLQLSQEDRHDIFKEIFRKKNITSAAVEKDWWVVLTLRLIFEMDIASTHEKVNMNCVGEN
jgi:hypothetical protein